MIFSASLNGINDLANDLVLLIFLAVFTVITALVGVWIIAASAKKPDSPMIGRIKAIGVVWLVVVVGFAIRVAFSLLTVGYLGSVTSNPMTNTNGLMGLYNYLWDTIRSGFGESNQYPVHAYIQLFFAKILDIFGGFNQNGNVIMRLFFRLPYMLCDAAAAIVLYKIAKKYSNSQTGVAIAAIYSLCPIFFFSSGIWGSAMSMLSLLMILAFFFLSQKNYLAVTITFGLALLTAQEAVFFLPVFGVFYVFGLIRAIKAYKDSADSRSLSFKQLFLDKERGNIIRIPAYILGSLLVMYLLHLPMLGYMNYNFFTWFSFIYIKPFTGIKTFGNNAFSVYNLFGRNNAELGASTPVWLISLAFLIIATALVVVLYTSKKNRANLIVIAAYMMVTLGVYAMGFSEMSLLPVLGVMLLAFVLIKDKRILQIFLALSFIMILNAGAVMASAGYFSSINIVDFALYDSSAMLSATTFGQAMSIICSAFAMLTHLYFTFVVLDISMANRRLMLDTNGNSFGEAMKAFAKREKK